MTTAKDTFDKQVRTVGQFIQIHKKLRGDDRGRRYNQEALNQASIVMIVAAWQAYIEELLENCLDKIKLSYNISSKIDQNLITFELLRNQFDQQIRKFNTPNCENVQKLFRDTIGFDPFTCWEYRCGPRQWDFKETRERTNLWVKIRHQIAHGSEIELGHQNYKDHWLVDKNRKPRLILKSTEEVIRHFTHLVKRMEEEVPKFLKDKYRIE